MVDHRAMGNERMEIRVTERRGTPRGAVALRCRLFREQGTQIAARTIDLGVG
jgi:hypothetical protein